jgi:hypothetical protein
MPEIDFLDSLQRAASCFSNDWQPSASVSVNNDEKGGMM